MLNLAKVGLKCGTIRSSTDGGAIDGNIDAGSWSGK